MTAVSTDHTPVTGELAAHRGPAWRVALALAAIAALAAGLRFWRLDAIPPGFHYDEAYEALEAWRVITQPGYRPIFFPGNFGVEPMFIYLTSLAFRLFGETPAVMRGVAAVVGALTALAVFGLGRELARNDRRFPLAAAWLAALALATMRWHITFSRVGIEPILTPLCLTLLLWAFWRAWRTGRLLAWIATGVAAGAGLYIYPAARLLVGLLVLLTLLAVIAARRPSPDAAPPPAWPALARGLVVAWLAAGLTTLPMAWNWLQHPDQLLLRSSQISVGPGGAATRGTPGENLLATLGMFSFRGDPDPRNNAPGMPVFDPLISIPFMIGVGLTAWRGKRPVFASLALAGLLMLIPTIFSEDAPHFRRAVGATPIAAFCVGLGLAVILGRRQETPQPADAPWSLRDADRESAAQAVALERLQAWGRALAVAVFLAGSAVHSVVAYFDVWGRSNALFYAYDEGLWEIGRWALELPRDTARFLSPRPADDMTLAFAWRNGPVVRRFDGRHAFVAPQHARPAVYIIIEHEDFRGAMLLRDLYPDAQSVRRFYDRQGRLYAQAFHVARPDRLARHPAAPLEGRWPGVRLIGYDIDKTVFAPGEKIFLQLWWRADAADLANWTVFTHVVGPPKADGSPVWAGLDAPPGQGSAVMPTWAAGDVILDEYQIALPGEMPSGDYALEIGLYLPAEGGRRLPLEAPAGQDHLILRTVRVQ